MDGTDEMSTAYQTSFSISEWFSVCIALSNFFQSSIFIASLFDRLERLGAITSVGPLGRSSSLMTSLSSSSRFLPFRLSVSGTGLV